jgi:mono/diheme cytochrome c family protein
MRSSYLPIAVAVAVLAVLPLGTSSNTTLNFLSFALIVALAAQGWNILGGYGGQFSFGHAAFFGTGAYGMALLQVRFGLNPWLALPVATMLGAVVGAAIGALSFRARLRGSYFALVTLAFAEVFRILANAWGFTGGAAGVLVRHFFNLRHRGRIAPGYPLAALALLAALAVAIAPLRPAAPSGGAAEASAEKVTMQQVQAIISARCVSCHAAQPTQPGFSQPPGGVMLDSAERIQQQAGRIHQQAVLARVMPPGNLTGITDEERATLGRWLLQSSQGN